jgi:hypothetical protein
MTITEINDFDPSFSKTEPLSNLRPEPNLQNLKFERQDWTLFRTVEGLQQKAGVQAKLLRRLVLKELGDNALDTGTKIRFGYVDKNQDVFYVEDDGPGLDGDPEEIAELFSVRRPMRSSKLLRLPQRGALGNGLRVAAGAVLASEGSLVVISRNSRIVLRPESDGSTSVLEVTTVDHPTGTRIEIGFGPGLPRDDDEPLEWIELASKAVQGESYEGKSSPSWYDGAQFHELLLAAGAQPVRSLIAQLDGCSGGKAGEIVAAAGLERKACNEVSRDSATYLLKVARYYARSVNPKRLGGIGPDGFQNVYYAAERGTAGLGSSEPLAEIPFVVEAWARKLKDRADGKNNLRAILFINRTPSVDQVSVYRDGDKDLTIRGSGIDLYTKGAPRRGSYIIIINVITPYCPITSDGKAPDLSVFGDQVMDAVASAMNKAHREAPKDNKLSQKDVVLANLDRVVAEVGGGGQHRFNERQVLYRMRPIVTDQIKEELQLTNFKTIITDYENENGEIPKMYREPRGSIYHPHRRETFALGTLMVEGYKRPAWTFNKFLYIEKEGFSEALKDVGFFERHDCAPASSKGYTSRAIRDLVDKLAEHDEPLTVFCVTDADAYGTMIYQTFQEATKARGARKIKIVHIGLHPWEAIEAGMEIEKVEESKRRKAVAEYVLERDDRFPGEAPGGISWEKWLQTNRIELNTMTTPEFIEWLDAKMAKQGIGKLIPPDDVIEDELEDRLEEKVRDIVKERILREAGYEDQVTEALDEIERPDAAALKAGIEASFVANQENEWRKHIEDIATNLTGVADE